MSDAPITIQDVETAIRKQLETANTRDEMVEIAVDFTLKGIFNWPPAEVVEAAEKRGKDGTD